LVETVTVSVPAPAIDALLVPVGTTPPDQFEAVPKSPVTPLVQEMELLLGMGTPKICGHGIPKNAKLKKRTPIA
jgi:hypothetical protein